MPYILLRHHAISFYAAMPFHLIANLIRENGRFLHVLKLGDVLHREQKAHGGSCFDRFYTASLGRGNPARTNRSLANQRELGHRWVNGTRIF